MRPTISDHLQHEQDCKLLLGEPFSNVHRWLDEPFGQFGAAHRKARHHRQGIEELRRKWGNRAALAATIHVLRDCQGIPEREDYEQGKVDPLGFPANRSVRQIVSYTEEEFHKLAFNTIDDEHKCLLLLGWLETAPALLQLIRTVMSNPRPDVQTALFEGWERARELVNEFVESAAVEKDDIGLVRESSFESVSSTDFERLGDTARAILENLRMQLASVEYGWIPASELINPLQLIDLDYANHLANEIPSEPNESDAMVFAAPPKLNINAQAFSDANSATVITRFQEFHLSAIERHVDPDVGLNIQFKISPLPQYILVIEQGGRYYLRSGMHRAFVLARAGLQRIPCFLARNVEIPSIVGPYPVYPMNVLELPRPPKLLDALDHRLVVRTAFQQTRRLIRISAEDIAIPVN